MTIANAAGDKKAENIVLLDVRGLASFTDYLVIASGNSDRQVRAIGEYIEESVEKIGGPKTIGREGYEQGQWILADFGEVVVHVFEEQQRQGFDLEQLWREAPRVTFNPAAPPIELFATQAKVSAVAGGRRSRR